LAYEQVCASYTGITDFRGKLLTLLPLATGAGALLILNESSSNSSPSTFLGPVGLFGIIVTMGVYLYEFRGIQRCRRLETQAKHSRHNWAWTPSWDSSGDNRIDSVRA
jgi:hypothetical protein